MQGLCRTRIAPLTYQIFALTLQRLCSCCNLPRNLELPGLPGRPEAVYRLGVLRPCNTPRLSLPCHIHTQGLPGRQEAVAVYRLGVLRQKMNQGAIVSRNKRKTYYRR